LLTPFVIGRSGSSGTFETEILVAGGLETATFEIGTGAGTGAGTGEGTGAVVVGGFGGGGILKLGGGGILKLGGGILKGKGIYYDLYN